MKNLQQLKTITISAALMAVFAIQTARAESQISINGEWHAAKEASQVDVWNNNALINSKIPAFGKALARQFIEQNNQLLGVNEKITLDAVSENTSDQFHTVRMQKKLWGLEVRGGEAVVNISNNRVELVNADNTNLDGIQVIPSLSSKDAENIAFASYQGKALSAGDTKLKVLVSKDANGENIANLVYQVTVRDQDRLSSDIHFIDAQRGREVLATSNVHTIKDRKVSAGAGNDSDFDLDETNYKLVYADAGCNRLSMLDNFAVKATAPKTCNKVSKPLAQSADYAFKNSGLVYDYYKTEHNRDSIDNAGLPMKSVINFGSKFSNAAWISDKSIMIYGMGDGKMFNDFAVALDVAGHELTHGITSRTADLEYVGESGAMNESYSDVFGKLIDIKYGKGAADWKIGKSLFKDGKNAIRDMENPEVGNTKDFKYRGETCGRDNDFCGVHTNSGITNKAAVMIVKAIGADKTAKIYYLTLTQLLRSTSDFKDARAQTEAACAKLFGKDSADCKTVSSSFAAVGI